MTNNFKPESLHVVRHGGVITNSIPSQAFLFGEDNVSKFIRRIGPPCACGCGKPAKWNKWQKRWNKFINGHRARGKNFFRQFEIPPLCKCGCGRHTKWNKAWKRWNKFINGHQNIGENNPMKRPEIAAKLSGNQHAKGTKHTKEQCEAQSKRITGKNNPMKRPEILAKISGKNNPNYGKRRPKIIRQAIAEKLKGPNSPRYGKKFSEHSERMSGEKHPNWKGGISCEPYCEIWTDKKYKQSIRDRDNNECQNPDCWGKCNPNHALSLHHINHIKKDCNPWNLISLCKSCNVRAEKNKEYWQNLYQNIMVEKYGYGYKNNQTAA